MSGLTVADSDGMSPVRGPVGAIGALALLYGVTGLAFGGSDFATRAVDGPIDGATWLAIEGNGWTNALFAVGGLLLLLLGASTHLGAKVAALAVGLAFGAASVIALLDGRDVLGIFAANGPTMLAWGLGAVVLLALSAAPRSRRRAAPAGLTGPDADAGRRRKGLRFARRPHDGAGARSADGAGRTPRG